MPSLFIGNNRQHLPICAKVISSWVRNVLSIGKAHASSGSFQGAVALVAGVYLVSIFQAGNRSVVSPSAGQLFATYHYHRTAQGFGPVCCPGP